MSIILKKKYTNNPICVGCTSKKWQRTISASLDGCVFYCSDKSFFAYEVCLIFI